VSDIDNLQDFTNPEMTMVRKIIYGDTFAVVGVAFIRGQTYAIPLIWNDEDDAYEVLHVSILLQHKVVGLNFWSIVGVDLRNPARDEIMHLLIPGVANLPHPPRRSRE
jgi:hypothetical protein